MKNVLQFIDGNNEYYIKYPISFQVLKNRSDLVDLSIQSWSRLLTELYGVSFESYLIQVLLLKISYYDRSTNINGFLYNNKDYWFDKITRSSLLTIANNTSDLVTLVLGDESVSLSSSKAVQFLVDLEKYASQCYIVTNNHLSKCKQLRLKEDILNYDYTSDYPKKINLNEYL